MAVKRARVHSRDIQPQIVAPKGLFAAARVQRLDFPLTIPTTNVDELGRTLHVGTTQETPEIRVSFEAFDVSHNTFAYLTGYTPASFPASGASVTQFQNVDMIGQIRNANTSKIVNAIYAKKLAVTGMDASFDVRGNSTVTYTAEGNSKKEFSKPVFYSSVTASGGQVNVGLDYTPSYLTRTSGYVINAYSILADGTMGYLVEGTDFNVSGTNVVLTTPASNGDFMWFTYCSAAVDKTFEALDDAAPAAIQGKYVPVTISVSDVKRVQSVRIRVARAPESIMEMGGLGKPVGYETGIPDVTGDISVLKTDNDIISLLEGVSSPVENDMEYARTDLPLKVQLKNPSNPSQVLLTYYLPSLTWTAEGDESTVNQSMNETFSFTSTTGELFIASGVGPW